MTTRLVRKIAQAGELMISPFIKVGALQRLPSARPTTASHRRGNVDSLFDAVLVICAGAPSRSVLVR